MQRHYRCGSMNLGRGIRCPGDKVVLAVGWLCQVSCQLHNSITGGVFFGVYSTIRASVGHRPILKVTHQVAALTRPAYMYASALLSRVLSV